MDDIEAFRRQLRFRAWHRGTREADLILGPFADRFVPGWDLAALTLFVDFLEENDPDIYDWVLGKGLPPERFQPLMKTIQAFIAERAA